MIPPSRNRRRRKARRALRAALRPPVPAVLSKPARGAEAQTPPTAPAPLAALPAPIPVEDMTRRQMMAELDRLGVTYNPRANRSALSAALWAAMMLGNG